MTTNAPDTTTEAPQAQDKKEEKIIAQAAETVSNEAAEVTNEDPNWKAFRDARKKDRAEREAAEKRAHEKEAEVTALKAALEASLGRPSAYQQPQAQSTYNNGYEAEETEDERIEKKVKAAIAAREAEYEKHRVQREREEYPQRILKNYADFNQVVSQENLDYLEYHYPEVAHAFGRLADDYNKWEDIYKTVKKFVPNAVGAKKEAAKAESNLMKPKSMSGVGATQNTDAAMSVKLAEDRKMQNWQRMQKILKGVS